MSNAAFSSRFEPPEKGIMEVSLKKRVKRSLETYAGKYATPGAGKNTFPREGECGMMVVEAVLSFMVFLMVVVAIIYLINIFTIHNKIQFAINSAAHELASYTYIYQALGIRGAEQTLDSDGNPYTQPIDDTVTQVVDSLNGIQNWRNDVSDIGNSFQEASVSPEHLGQIMDQFDRLATDTSQTVDSIQQSVRDVTELFRDRNSLIAGVIYMGASAASYAVKSIGATIAAGALTKKYLGDSGADSFLQSYGIADGYAGLDFSGSTMFCDDEYRIIDIVVEYDIDMGFIGLIMPENKLHVVQRVSVPAWLDGDGKTYEP